MAPSWHGRLKLPLTPPECSTLISSERLDQDLLAAETCHYFITIIHKHNHKFIIITIKMMSPSLVILRNTQYKTCIYTMVHRSKLLPLSGVMAQL